MMVWHVGSPVSSESAKVGKLAGSIGFFGELLSYCQSITQPAIALGRVQKPTPVRKKICSILNRFYESQNGIILN